MLSNLQPRFDHESGSRRGAAEETFPLFSPYLSSDAAYQYMVANRACSFLNYPSYFKFNLSFDKPASLLVAEVLDHFLQADHYAKIVTGKDAILLANPAQPSLHATSVL
jgi:hypothetical protein